VDPRAAGSCWLSLEAGKEGNNGSVPLSCTASPSGLGDITEAVGWDPGSAVEEQGLQTGQFLDPALFP
jgi:hypothetical protein